MNWDALGAIAELIGGLAVLVTLIYLSVQIRQSNRQEAAQSVKDAFTAFVDAYSAATETEEKAKNFRDGLIEFDDLGPVEQAMFQSKMQALGNGYYQVWTLYKNGMLADQELFERSRDLFLNILRTPGARQWWSQWKHMPPQTWINELDQQIHDPNSKVTPTTEALSWYRPNE